MKKLIAGLLVASAVVTSARAETWYMRVNSQGGMTNPGHWKNASGVAATAFSMDDNYVVDSTRFRATYGTFVYPLSVGYEGGSCWNAYVLHEANLTFSDFTVYQGYLTPYHNKSALELHGTMTVKATKSAPFGICGYDTSHRNGVVIYATLTGDESAGIVVGGRWDGSKFLYSDSATGMSVECSFYDLSQYKGDIHLLSNAPFDDASGKNRVVGFYENTEFPGSLEADTGGALYAHGVTLSVNRLTAHGGSRLSVQSVSGTVGQFKVTGDFVKDGDDKVQVQVMSHPTEGTDPLRIPVLTVPATQDLDVADFDLLDADGIPAVEVDEGAGTKALVVYYPTSVTVTANDKGSYTGASDDGTAFANAACFSDGKTPHAFANYKMKGGQINTPWEEDYVFPGLSYTVEAGATATMLFCGGSATFADLVWNSSNTQIWIPSGMSPTLKGKVTVGGKAVLMLYNGSVFTVDAELCGSGTWYLSGYQWTSVPQATLVFNGINTNWFGQLDVAMVKRVFDKPSKYTDFPCLTIYHRIQFADGRGLGGALPEFRYDSIRLGGYTALQPLASTTLDAANRGILVDEAAQVFTGEGVELSCRMPITMNGTLYKTLPGTLALGGGVKFLAGGALTDEPPADVALRTLVVTNGCVKALTHDCVNGLRVDLAANHDTSLAIDFDAQDPDLRRYGFYNVKTSDPFATEAGKRIRVRLANLDPEALLAARRTDEGFKQGLVTVKTETADALAACLDLERPAGVPLHLVREDDAESGLTTFSAYSKRTGTMILFR